jgi:hypothetical protein
LSIGAPQSSQQINPCPKEVTAGVRLYPNTEHSAVLEKLARVPSGTMRRLNNLKAVKVCTRKGVDYYLVAGVPHLMRRRDFNDMEAIWDAEWQATQAGPDVARLGHFIMDGWGKMGSVPFEAMRVHRPLEVKVSLLVLTSASTRATKNRRISCNLATDGRHGSSPMPAQPGQLPQRLARCCGQVEVGYQR